VLDDKRGVTDKPPDQPGGTSPTAPPQLGHEEFIEKNNLSSKGWKSHRKTILGWTGGLLAATLGAVVVPLLQSVINDGIDAAAGREPYILNVRLGPEDVAFPRAYEDDPDVKDNLVQSYPGSYYFTPGKLRSLGAPPVLGRELGCNATREWANKNGGLDYGVTVGEIIITAKKDIVVRGARIASERQILRTPGEVAECPVGGPLGAQYLHINLDKGTATDLKADSNGEREVDTPVGFQLQSGESERIVFYARAGGEAPQKVTSLVEWKLVFDALVDGKAQKITVGNQDGSPFLTVLGNPSEQTHLVYRADRSAWDSPYN
jgi:hypothetical protein